MKKKMILLLSLLLKPTAVFAEGININPSKFLLEMNNSINSSAGLISSTAKESDPLNWYSYTIILVVFLGIFLYFQKISHSRKDEEIANSILDLSPAEASSLILGDNIASNFILATLLKFSENNLITISKEDYITEKKKIKRTNYIFKKTSESTSKLSANEKYLYNMLFSENDEFSTRELNKKRIDSPLKFNEEFGKYLQSINTELVEKGLKNKNLKYPIIGVIVLLISILFLVVSIISLILGNKISLIVLAASVGLFIISLKIIGFQTARGYEQSMYYKDMYNTLLQNDDIKNYQRKNQKNLIIYSIAFAIPFERINHLKNEFSIDSNFFIPLYWDGENISNMQSEMNRALLGNVK